MKEDSPLLYTDIIIACVQLRQTVGDGFFVAALDEKLKDFIRESRLQSVAALLELLAQLEHLQLGDALQLLVCRELLLQEKLSLLGDVKKPAEKPAVEAAAKPTAPAPAPTPVKAISPKPPRVSQRTQKANQAKEEILAFIRKGKPARSKEIAERFSALSQRTILRNLKELVDQGLVAKQSESDGVIRYVAS